MGPVAWLSKSNLTWKLSARGLSVLIPVVLVAFLLGGPEFDSAWALVGIILVGIAAEFFTNRWFAGRFLRARLDIIATGIEALRIGEFNHQMPDLGRDELGELARSFNKMSIAVAQAMFELRAREDAIDDLNVTLATELENLKTEMMQRELVEQELAQHRDNLEDLVRERTENLQQAQLKLIDTSRAAGKAELANQLLHEVGNALTPLMTDAGLLQTRLRTSKADVLVKLADTLESHEDDIGRYFSEDPKGKLVPKLLKSIATKLSDELAALREHSCRISDQTSLVNAVVQTQQTDSAEVAVNTEVLPAVVLDEVAERMRDVTEAVGAEIVVQAKTWGCVIADHNCLVRALEDVVRNAANSVVKSEDGDRTIQLSVRAEEEMLHFEVTDNGVGMTEEERTDIFSHAVTDNELSSSHSSTNDGASLHRCANSVRAIGYSIEAESEGPGQGSTLRISVPVVPVPEAKLATADSN